MKRHVLSSLLTGVEFLTPERARKATDVIENAVRGLCEGLAHKLPAPKSKNQNAETMQELSVSMPPRTPPRCTVGPLVVDDASPNPFEELEATLETYKAYIYGSITLLCRREMLAVAQRRTGHVVSSRTRERSMF
jgi:regulator of Ty1 transposition protein 109